MFCPHTIVLNTRFAYVVRHERTDYGSRKAPLLERLNLLRYATTIRLGWPPARRFTINRDGILERWRSDAVWHLWKKRLPRYR
jgi:hypothetical protein